MGTDAILSIRDLVVRFGQGHRARDVVRGVSFDIGRGETFALVGESGSGKTSIARAVMRLNEAHSGSIHLEGRRISGKIDDATGRWALTRAQMIFQDPLSSLNERATVDYIVSEGLTAFGLCANEAERRERARKALEEVGLLPEHLSRYPHEFSGGQRQRIGIARALALSPALLVADEPVSALDVSVRSQVLNLFLSLKKSRGLSTFFISHDLTVVRHIADRVGVINGGRLLEVAPAAELFARPLHSYTRALLDSVPVPDPLREKGRRHVPWKPEGRESPLVDKGNGHFVADCD